MSKRNLPDPFGVDKQDFSVCFSKRSMRHFLMVITGWVLTVGRHTISRVILTLGLQHTEHFATVYRFFSRAVWDCDTVSWIVFRIIVRAFLRDQTELVCVVDDTLHKHRGRKICGAGFQHDGAVMKGEMPVGFGLCFVIIGLVVRLPSINKRPFCLPFAARLWWPRKTKVKPRSPYRTKPELARELISLTHSWLDEGVRLRVLVDRGYCVEAVLKGRQKEVRITGRISVRSALHQPVMDERQPRRRGCPRKKGDRLPAPKEMFADLGTPWRTIRTSLYGHEVPLLVHQFPAVWYRSAGNAPLNVVLSRDPSGKHSDCVFLDTEQGAPAGEILSPYCARWSMEITIRETKGLLGSADPQCRSEQAVIRAPMIAYWAYSMVVVWFFSQYRKARDLVPVRAPWYQDKKAITFSDMLAAARRSHFRAVFSDEDILHTEVPKNRAPRSTRQHRPREMAKL